MKLIKIIKRLIILGIFAFILIYHKDISNYIISNLIYNKNASITINKNEYSKNTDYSFVQVTDDFLAKDYQHLLNILYTILDSGENTFHFYCDDSYINCLNDIDSLIPDDSNDQSIMSEINNFIHPFNSYQKIKVITNNFGKVTLEIIKQYNHDDIQYINDEIDLIVKSTINDEMTKKDKILAFHDYIIDITEYDIERAENMNDVIYKDSITHTAYGLFKTNKALCGGYSDLMSIYLFQLGIDNIRISADNHVWNLLYIDSWVHLDMTWDDPVTNTGEQFLIHDYFLISTKELHETDEVEHNFDSNIFIEAK